MNQGEVFNFLYYTNNMRMAYGPQVTSTPYFVPTIEWIKKEYSPFLRNFLVKNGVSSSKNPENNCVKFSSYGLTAGYILHYKEGPKGGSLAIGIVDYVKNFYVAHSINFFLASDNNKIVVIYYEPQLQQIINGKEVETEWWSLRL